MLPPGSGENDALGKLMKPALAVWLTPPGVWPTVVTTGRRQEKATAVRGKPAVAVGVAVAAGVAVALGESVATSGVSVISGVARFVARCDVDVPPQAAVMASTMSGTSSRCESLATRH
jgi:hypothetical protein